MHTKPTTVALRPPSRTTTAARPTSRSTPSPSCGTFGAAVTFFAAFALGYATRTLLATDVATVTRTSAAAATTVVAVDEAPMWTRGARGELVDERRVAAERDAALRAATDAAVSRASWLQHIGELNVSVTSKDICTTLLSSGHCLEVNSATDRTFCMICIDAPRGGHVFHVYDFAFPPVMRQRCPPKILNGPLELRDVINPNFLKVSIDPIPPRVDENDDIDFVAEVLLPFVESKVDTLMMVGNSHMKQLYESFLWYAYTSKVATTQCVLRYFFEDENQCVTLLVPLPKSGSANSLESEKSGMAASAVETAELNICNVFWHRQRGKSIKTILEVNAHHYPSLCSPTTHWLVNEGNSPEYQTKDYLSDLQLLHNCSHGSGGGVGGGEVVLRPVSTNRNPCKAPFFTSNDVVDDDATPLPPLARICRDYRHHYQPFRGRHPNDAHVTLPSDFSGIFREIFTNWTAP